MTYQEYYAAMQTVARLVEEQRYDEALRDLQRLLDAGLQERDRAMICYNMGVVHSKLGTSDEVLAWYDRGIDYERPHRRHLVAEYKAAYLVELGRKAEALALYDSLSRERSIDEAEKYRFENNVAVLRDQLGRR